MKYPNESIMKLEEFEIGVESTGMNQERNEHTVPYNLDYV